MTMSRPMLYAHADLSSFSPMRYCMNVCIDTYRNLLAMVGMAEQANMLHLSGWVHEFSLHKEHLLSGVRVLAK